MIVRNFLCEKKKKREIFKKHLNIGLAYVYNGKVCIYIICFFLKKIQILKNVKNL